MFLKFNDYCPEILEFHDHSSKKDIQPLPVAFLWIVSWGELNADEQLF